MTTSNNTNLNYFSTEQITMYHPDKACDQISDAILTAYLKEDRDSHCGIETLWKGGTIVLAGEITSEANLGKHSRVDIAYRVAEKLGYKVSCVDDLISEQSPEIKLAVDSRELIGAGDQGMMYGFAVRDTDSYLPKGFDLANIITDAVTRDVTGGDSPLLGDAKTQVTMAADGKREWVDTILVSACHTPDVSVEEIRNYIKDLLHENIGAVITGKTKLIINPAGSWTIGGPTADCGLTGRKIVCDQYGGYAPVGGGAFSGKDPSKVDRSASYMARYLAVTALKRFSNINRCEIQLAYAIGVPQPVSIGVRTDDVRFDSVVADWINGQYDLSPRGIINRLHLLDKDYEQIAEGCHYRRDGVLKGEI